MLSFCVGRIHAQWVHNQRKFKKKTDKRGQPSLSATRIDMLDSVFFDWGKRNGDELWEKRYGELVAYNKKHGDCNVPADYKRNTKLGSWVREQRKQYKKGDNAMTEDKKSRLNALRFSWKLA